MIFYLLCHSRSFLAAQVESIRRHNPGDSITILKPFESREQFPEFPVIECGIGRSLLILQSVWETLPDVPSVFLEWDMVLTKTITVGNAVNREPDSFDNCLYPSFLSWSSKAEVPADYLKTQIDKPFVTPFGTVQQEWIMPGNVTYPPCAANSYFRTLSNGILHFHYGAGYRSPEGISDNRLKCWNDCMDLLSLPHLYANLASPTAAVNSVSSALPYGPGTELKKLLAGWPFHLVASSDCKCNKRARYMDEKGCDWVEANIEECVGYLRESAADRGLPFVDVAGRMLVRRAIHNARRSEAARAKDDQQKGQRQP
jgi:hypothetical protein